MGVRLGDLEAWQPQKVGGCGWSMCPRIIILSHGGQDVAGLGLGPSLFKIRGTMAFFWHKFAYSMAPLLATWLNNDPLCIPLMFH